MKFKRYFDIKEFWNDNQKLLEEKEWYNCLMIGNCLDGVKNGMDNWFYLKKQFIIVHLIQRNRRKIK